MEAEFWNQRWALNKIGFHEGETNALLAKYFGQLQLKKNSRIFLPLCGKTRDIAWLLSQDVRIVGIELNQQAVEQLFNELNIKPNITQVGNLQHFSHHNIDIFVGDIFDLSPHTLGSVDAIYDRAALVALPQEMRSQYSTHLIGITNNAPQLLICFEYDQTLMNGPPFSINAIEVERQYADHCDITLINTVEVTNGLRNQIPATESVWILHRKTS